MEQAAHRVAIEAESFQQYGVHSSLSHIFHVQLVLSEHAWQAWACRFTHTF